MGNETFSRKGGFPAIPAVKPANPIGVRAVCLCRPERHARSGETPLVTNLRIGVQAQSQSVHQHFGSVSELGGCRPAVIPHFFTCDKTAYMGSAFLIAIRSRPNPLRITAL